jgi:hypothetical protein
LAKVLSEAHRFTLRSGEENYGFLRDVLLDQLLDGLLSTFARIENANSSFHKNTSSAFRSQVTEMQR